MRVNELDSWFIKSSIPQHARNVTVFICLFVCFCFKEWLVDLFGRFGPSFQKKKRGKARFRKKKKSEMGWRQFIDE